MHRLDLRKSTLVFAVVSAVAVAPSVAQRPSSWVRQSVPGVQAVDVTSRGKLVQVVRNDTLRVFSAATRRWVSRPLAAGATVRNTNDVVLVVEGDTFTALGAWRGAFEPLQAGPGASLVNPPTQGNDGVFLVRDGGTLHAFSGFVGAWTSRSLPNGATVSVERDVAVIAAGTQLWGYSALHGSWVPFTAAGAATTVLTDGNLALVLDGTTAYAFSALQNRWASATLPAGGGNPEFSKNVALWTGTFESVAYSAHRAGFARAPANGPGQTTLVDDHYAVVRGPGDVVRFYSGPENGWTAVSVLASAAQATGSGTVAWLEGTRVVAISAFVPSPATLPTSAAVLDVNTTVAAVSGANGLALYSGLTGTWHPAPAGAANRLPPLARQGALLDDGANTVWAFDARRGTFHARSVQGPPGLQVNGGSSLLAIEHGGGLDCFDPRTLTWHRTGLPNGPTNVQIWRTALIAGTATRLVGFSALHGDLETVDLPAAPNDLRASSEVGVAVGADAVFAFAGVPAFSPVAQFPEFRRPAVRGATLSLYASGPAQAGIAAVSSLTATAPLSTPLGDVWLNPAIAFALPIGALDLDGLAVLEVPFADDPNLRGLEIGLQAALLPGSGATPWVTRLATFTLF